jgi:hypothetical protein
MPDPISSSTTSELSSPLIQRLERRHNEPVGLVNSLSFQPRAAKIPQAIVQRSALVQQLQTRYGTHTNEVAESELVLANSLDLEVPNNTLSTVANSIATIKKEGKKQEPSPEGRFRVSRKAIPKISQMDASPIIQTKLDTHIPVNSLMPTTDEMPLATAVKTELQPSISELAKSHVSPTVQSPSLQMITASTPSLPLSKTEVIQRSPVDTSIPSTPSNLNAVKAGLTSTANSLPVVSELPFSSLLLQRANDEDVVDLGYIDFPSFDNSARVDSMLPFRQNVQRINLQENSNVNIQGINADYARTNPRTKNAPTAFPLNTGSVYESISEERSFSTLVPAPVTISKEPQTPPQEIDVAQIAEQVSRNLFRQLRIERERRGFSR